MSKLGDQYFEKASKYEDGTPEASALLYICGTCDLYNDNIGNIVQHLKENYVDRYKMLVDNPKRTEALKQDYRTRLRILSEEIEELGRIKQ